MGADNSAEASARELEKLADEQRKDAIERRIAEYKAEVQEYLVSTLRAITPDPVITVNLVFVPREDCVCPSCGNEKCSKSDTPPTCYRCGTRLVP